MLASDQPFRASDSYEGLSVFDLGPGDYRLTVRGTNDIAGNYAFRLIDLSSAPLLETGVPVSGVLNPASETEAYRLPPRPATAFTDRTAHSGGDTYWRLLDPFGKTVWGPTSINNDVDVAPLPFDGIYTLLIEGRYYDGGQASYAFNVSPSPLQAPVVIDGLGTVAGPDLVVRELAVTPVGTAGVRAGGQVLVSWQVTNNGSQDAEAPWLDRVLVRNMDRSGELIANLLVDYLDLGAAAATALAPGESRTRQALVTLVGGARGAGNLRFEVSTDVTNVVAEPGVSELNNAAALLVVSELSPYPDLVVDNIAVTPANGWAAGSSVGVSWRVANGGDSPTSGGWNDALVVRNLDTGAVLLNTVLAYDPAVDGALDNGDNRERSISFSWPAGAVGTGRFEFRVVTDVDGVVFESNLATTPRPTTAARSSWPRRWT